MPRTIGDAVDLVGRGIRDAAALNPGIVTLDWDHGHFQAGHQLVLGTHGYQRTEPRHGI